MRSFATRTFAALAIAALPAAAFAQSQAAAQQNPAAEHLAAARAALNKVLNAPAPSGDAFKKLSDLKTEYIALEKSAGSASAEWATHYAAVDRLVGELIGPPAAASAEPGAVGTSGRAGVMKGVEAGVAANLETFRTELKAFSTAMSAVVPAAASTAGAATPSAAAASATPSAAATSATPSPAPAPMTGAAGSVVTGSAATPAPAPATPAAPASSTAASVGTTSGSGADASVGAQIDPVIALVDAALAGSAVDASGKVSVDRATLQQIKAQLLQIKQGKKP